MIMSLWNLHHNITSTSSHYVLSQVNESILADHFLNNISMDSLVAISPWLCPTTAGQLLHHKHPIQTAWGALYL